MINFYNKEDLIMSKDFFRNVWRKIEEVREGLTIPSSFVIEIWMSQDTFNAIMEYKNEVGFSIDIKSFGEGMNGVRYYGYPIKIQPKMKFNEIYVNLIKK